MREITAFSSAIADVALSEPWLGILPIALYGSPDLRDELLPRALLVYRAAWQHDATERSISREAAIAKLFSTETAFDIIDEAVQIFGGLGLGRGTTVERLFRHARAFRILRWDQRDSAPDHRPEYPSAPVSAAARGSRD